MDTLRQDLRYSVRRLLRAPSFTAVAVLTLALGIGANAAIFSVVHGVLLKPLPYERSDRLVGLFHLSEGRRVTMSGPNFTDLKQRTQTLSGAAAFARYATTLTGRGEPVHLDAAAVTTELFDVLRVTPVLGRGFRPEDSIPGKSNVVILSWPIWQQRFGGDVSAIGQAMILDGAPKEIVGVMPQGFSYPAGRALWTPIEHTEHFLSDQRANWYLSSVGRVRGGVPIEQVIAEVRTIGQQLAQQYPDANEGVGLDAMPLLEATIGSIRTAVLVLLGAVGFVLLIACANVANLLLARAAAREAEMAVRTALGAARGRLVRQLLTESVLLSALGAVLGLLIAVWGVEFLVSLQPQGVPRLDEVGVNGTVIAFAAFLAILTGLIFGLVPAWQSTRSSLTGLKEGGRGALTTRSGAYLRGSLVIAEMAVAVMLLAGAGLLVRSFARLASVDPGFSPEQALTFELSLPETRYGDDARQVEFYNQLLERLRAVPGVRSTGAVLALPLTGTSIVLSFEVAGRPPLPPSQQPAMQIRIASPDYFRTIGIPLERGRFFTDQDRAGTTPVALLTASAARQFFPGEDPIGKRIILFWRRGPGAERVSGEVVGLIGDVKDAGLAEAEAPQLYLAHQQWPVRSMSIVMKTAVPPASVADVARAAVHGLDPALPVSEVRTLEDVVAGSISQPRFYMMLLAAFAALALTLAAVGIFGVLSYAVSQRTREIGIRMALGARQRSVVALVVRQAMLLSIAGAAVGLGGAWLVSRSLTSLLFATSPADAPTFIAASALLLTVALAASFLPARRAARVDPIVALRAE